jgi:uncharacterized protein (TIGR03083 family)
VCQVSVDSNVSRLVSQADSIAADLAAYLESLPAERWELPSDCAGWSVAGVVAHLVLVEALLGTNVERGLRGESGPPPEAADLAAWRDIRARELQRLSALPPSELLAEFRAGSETMREALTRTSAPEAAGLRAWHPSGPQPIAWFAGQWLIEVGLHDWDLRVALDESAEIHQALLPSLGDQMRARVPRCYKPAQDSPANGIVRIELQPRSGVADTAAPSTAWLVRLSGSSVELLDDGAATPDATIQSDPAAYALVQTGRRPASLFRQQDRWRISGQTALADQLTESFRGY